VHPRPDQRHIKYQDVRDLKPVLSTEFNIEGYPSKEFIELVIQNKPAQVTLVPDPPEALTSNAGWNAESNFNFLSDIVKEFNKNSIRVSIFMNPDKNQIDWAKKTGTDRIELYTEEYAVEYSKGNKEGIKSYKEAARFAKKIGLGVNAGHDLNLNNLNFWAKEIPEIDEVSIGHALISDALYLGLENTIQLYRRALNIEHGIEL
jgi:pyridoxine 5-phosphate synthase